MTIINTLPYTIANGQAVDATPVMADLNQIVNNVNANAVDSASLAASGGANLAGFSASNSTSGTVARALVDRGICVTDAPFNADPTGVADSTAAFNSASANGLALVPAGTYKLSSKPTGYFYTVAGTQPSFTGGFAPEMGIRQPSTSQWFSQNAANIHRLADRVFVGDAVVSDGAYPQSTNDWLSTFYDSNGYTGSTLAGQLAVLTNANAAAGAAGLFGAQSQHFTSAGAAAIGVQAVGIANHATLAASAWAFYGEGHRINSAAGSVYGCELDIRALVSCINPTPYQQGNAVALQLAAGAGVSGTGQYNPSAAIQIESNPMPFQVGIVFGATALAGTSGTGSGNGTAIAMAAGHTLSWFNHLGEGTNAIYASTNTGANGTSIAMNDGGFNIMDSFGSQLLNIAPASSATANHLFLQGSPSGAGYISLAAVGSDANIDMIFQTTGSGTIRFGTYTAGAVTQAGYITVKDYGGTVRRLLVG